MRHIDTAERRLRLGVRHFLATPALDLERAARGVAGFHSSDPATVYLSAWSRLPGFAAADMEDALYDRKTLVRMLGMRRTIFVLPPQEAAVMDAACTRALVGQQRRLLVRMLEEQDIAPDGEAWVTDVSAAVMAALRDLGEATASELREHVPELKEKLVFGEGTSYGGGVGVSTRVMFLLAAEGRIVRGRPLGTWLSTQYRWAPVDEWLPGGLPPTDAGTAPADLLRLWLACYGPGTFLDLRWWTGWTVSKTRAALADVGAVEVATDEGPGYVLTEDCEPPPSPDPWVALLPGLDPAVMGWKERDWFLGPHQARLFDRNGNAGPTVWADGRIVGGWAQGPDGDVRVGLLEDVGAETRTRIEARAGELTSWLGPVRVSPRFPAPIQKELAG